MRRPLKRNSVADGAGNVFLHDVAIYSPPDLCEDPSLDLDRCTGPPRLIQDHPAEELDPPVSFGGDIALLPMRHHCDSLCERDARGDRQSGRLQPAGPR